MPDFSNIPVGLNITTQIPLDVKTISLTEFALASLGVSNNKAFTYYDGLKVFCLDTRKTYEWREREIGDGDGLLTSDDFTYPNNTVAFGVTYSNKIFNFFEISNTGPAGADGADGVGISNIVKTGTVGLIDTYTITYTDGDTSTFTVTNGAVGTNGTNGTNGLDATANNLQKVINANYTITNGDDNYTIFVNNSSTNITVTIPDGLQDSLSIGFIQEGTGDVTFVTSGVSVLNTVVGFKIAGQNDNVLLEKKLATSAYYLLGNTKL
jgi:hypothetical protein